jgi:hypothetical protein
MQHVAPPAGLRKPASSSQARARPATCPARPRSGGPTAAGGRTTQKSGTDAASPLLRADPPVRSRPAAGCWGSSARSPLGSRDPEQLFDARTHLDALLTTVALQRATPEDIRAMEWALEDMRAAGDDADAFLRANMRFHLAVARASKIKLLAGMYESIVAVLTNHHDEGILRRPPERAASAQHRGARRPDHSDQGPGHHEASEAPEPAPPGHCPRHLIGPGGPPRRHGYQVAASPATVSAMSLSACSR